MARKVSENMHSLMKERVGNVNWIVDLSRFEKVSSKARRILAEFQKSPNIRKMAFVGASLFMKTMANFIITASGTKNTKHFETEEEALKWLKS